MSTVRIWTLQLKKSSAVNSKQQEGLNTANARIAELEEQAKSINIDAIHKAHEDKLKKVESEAKGALDGAKARREAEVQSYKDKLGKLETEIKSLKEKVEDKTSGDSSDHFNDDAITNASSERSPWESMVGRLGHYPGHHRSSYPDEE